MGYSAFSENENRERRSSVFVIMPYSFETICAVSPSIVLLISGKLLRLAASEMWGMERSREPHLKFTRAIAIILYTRRNRVGEKVSIA